MVTADIQKIENLPYRYHFGGQWEVYQNAFIRGGLRNSDLTFGVGYQFQISKRTFALDYGFVPDPITPSPSHVFSCSFIL